MEKKMLKVLAQETGIDPKAIRKYARKNFVKDTVKGWSFTEEQVEQIIKHFAGTYTKARKGVKKAEGLTENEVAVLDWLINTGWYAEYMFSDVEVKEIAEGIGKSVASTKGYVGSLVKKGYLWVSEVEGHGADQVPPLVYPVEDSDKLRYDEETNTYSY